MPFPTFKYKEIINQTWEESDLRNSLEETKYMFFVFKMIDGEYVFKGIKLWNMPEIEIDNEIKQVWIKTVELIKNGNIVKSIDSNGTRSTYFPGMSENPICHVRPHAANSEDTYELPISDKYTGLNEYTKHCFWINSKYLENILKEFN
jgi:DNA mismatch repair protein MutH